MSRFFKTTVVAAALICANLRGADVSVPVDPDLGKQILDSIRTAQQQGESSKALRDFRRLLELYPNEPLVRAPMYLAMSDLAEKSGDADDAKQYRATALAIDPDLAREVEKGQSGGATRGSKADGFMAAFAVAAQTIAQVQQARAQYVQQHPQPVAAMPAQPVQFPAVPAVGAVPTAPPAGGFQPVGGFDPATGQPLPGAGASVPGPVIMGYDQQGQPIYNSPQPAGAMPQQQMVQQPMPQQQMPQQQVMPQQQMPQQMPQQQMPQQQMPQQQQPAMQRSMARQSYGNAPRMPYQANPGYSRGRTRGDANQPIRVLYDRSRLGDPAYFATACGALLNVEAGALTFSSGCGGTPLVIPAADITDLRMNAAVAKEIGAFHVATAKGLYLAFTAEDGSRDRSREIVDTLKKQLGITE